MLARVLGGLALQSHPVAHTVVVDNGSSDDSISIAQSRGAQVIALGENTGFANAVNVGIAASATSLVAVINNDVEFPSTSWLSSLANTLDAHPEAWFATGKIYQAGHENVLDGTFDAISRSACPCRCGHGRADGPQWSQPAAIDMAPFTAALFRRQLFHRIGWLDQRFESYLEDVDFGLRCVLAGCRGRYVPEATCTHWGSATLGVWNSETVRRLARNQVFLVAKHFPGDWPMRQGWPVLAGQLLWGMVAARHGCLLAYLRGKWQGIAQFDSVRAATPPEGDLSNFLQASEQLIGKLQTAGSASPDAVELGASQMDWYWRLYFAIT